MKADHWVLAAGAVFCIGLVGVALFPDDFRDDDGHGALVNPVGVSLGPSGPAPVGPDVFAGTGAMVPPPRAWPQNAALPGLVPFTRASTERFRGDVVRAAIRGGDLGWGQVYVWVSGGPGREQEISLAPDWYLQYQGCAVSEGMKIRGVAFKFDKIRPDAEIYAKTISVNGTTCRLRNDEGFALWSNQLQ